MLKAPVPRPLFHRISWQNNFSPYLSRLAGLSSVRRRGSSFFQTRRRWPWENCSIFSHALFSLLSHANFGHGGRVTQPGKSLFPDSASVWIKFFGGFSNCSIPDNNLAADFVCIKWPNWFFFPISWAKTLISHKFGLSSTLWLFVPLRISSAWAPRRSRHRRRGPRASRFQAAASQGYSAPAR